MDAAKEVPQRIQDNKILAAVTCYHDPFSAEGSHTHIFSGNQLKAIEGIEVVELIEEKLWAFKLCTDGVNVCFVIAQWLTEDDDDFFVEPVWFGNGTGDALRELRHSYFAHDGEGYIFYAKLSHIQAAAAWLATMFKD